MKKNLRRHRSPQYLARPRSALAALLSTGLLIGAPTQAQPAPVAASERPAPLADPGLLDGYPLFSGSLAIARHGQIVVTQSRGMANKAAGVRNGDETLFSSGSVGKMFTAVAIAQLAETGALTYGTAVVAIVPELADAVSDRVTVDDLLRHRSGLGNLPNLDPAAEAALRGNHDYFAVIASAGVRSEGPAGFAYRNTNYIVLGEIVARLSGEPYEDYVRDHISKRLGMTGPVFALKDLPDDAEVALPYLPVDYETWWNSEAPVVGKAASDYRFVAPIPTPSAGGGAYVSTRDMLRFARALRGNELISGASFAAMCALLPDEAEERQGYARGCSVRISKDGRRVGHTGSTAGVQARFFLYLDHDLDVVVLSNHEEQAAPVFDTIDERIALQARHPS